MSPPERPKEPSNDGRRSAIRTFLGRFIRDQTLADDDDIFALGTVNSLVALQLIQFVEGTFGVPVEDEDLDLDNFRSIAKIDELVERKIAARG